MTFLVQFAAMAVMSVAPANTGTDLPYSIADWSEAFGNHRAVVHVDAPADAVFVHIPWRRTDDQPEQKNIDVVFFNDTKPIANRVVVEVNREYGDLVFQAANPGDYYIYFMPYHPKHQAGFGAESYTPLAATADATWASQIPVNDKARIAQLPAATVTAFQARGEFNRRDPMEIPATQAERESLINQKPDRTYWVFPEDRQYPIRMRTDLPLRWIQQGAQDVIKGDARPNEYYTFQAGVFAARQALEDVHIECSPLTSANGAVIPPSAFNCINLGGVDWTGKSFSKRVDVPLGGIQPLWCGIDIPSTVQPGAYAGVITIRAANAPLTDLAVRLKISGEALTDRGDGELWRHARLRWLDSTLGLDDQIVAPYTPLAVTKNTVACLGRTVSIAPGGLLDGIRSNDNEILAAPMTFAVTTEAGPAAWNPSAETFTKKTEGKTVWEATADSDGFTRRVTCQMEFDGYLNFAITLTAKRDVSINDAQLSIPMRKEAATYMMGMGRKGGYRPDSWDWHWDKAKHQDSLWIGSVNAGLQCKLKGPNYSWPLVNIHYQRKPLDMPDAWNNNGKGGCRVQEAGDAVVICAYSGPRTLAAGETLQFNTGLLITPVKPINYAEHWKTRYYHAYEPVENAAKGGASVINIHHANEINPYINYPFQTVDRLAAYAQQAHDAGMKMKIYYTLREISNHMSELWAIRSLGTEVFADGPGGGYAWLQEHLKSGYIPAWQHFFHNGDVDASIVTQGLSRWHNYYLEGLHFLIANAGIDGLYLDDIGFDRDVMQRARKIMDSTKPGCLIDLHSWNHFNEVAGYANCANLYLEHFPYVNSLWFGEAFDYNETPDYWLVEISGIPYGMMSEMLQDGGNPWRGMIYGMTNRLPYCGNPQPLWKLWDDFAIQDARMLGYWDPACPVKTDNPDVLVTAYQKADRTLLSVASWAKEPASVHLTFDWNALGMKPESATLQAPEVEGLQPAASLKLTDPVTIDPGKGILMIVSSQTP